MLAEKARWLTRLLGSGASMLPAALCAAGAQGHVPHETVAAALSVLFGGLGSLLVNQMSSSLTESRNAELTERNHLVRRGMARALHNALGRAEEELKPYLPSELRDEFFDRWLALLQQAMNGDSELLDTVIPLQLSENQWDLLTRYVADPDQRWLEAQPREAAQRMLDLEEEDRKALAALLRDFPELPSADEPVRLFPKTLAARWTEEDANKFASKLLPKYRIAFGCVFSEKEGPESKAIEFKGMIWTQRELDEIQRLMESEFQNLKEHISKEHDATRGFLGEKIDRLQLSTNQILERVGGPPASQLEIPDFIYVLDPMEPVFGRIRQMDEARDEWLNCPSRRLLVYGSPGIGKSTFARSILRDTSVKDRFGARRFELQCDTIASAEDLVARMAKEWLGLIDEKPERLPQALLRRFGQQPCAILVDNFETLMRSRSGEVREKSRQWLARLASCETLWMIVGVQGREFPTQIPWDLVFEPEPLSEGDAIALFCSWSGMPHHARDPRLCPLLRDVDFVPLAVKLLGGIARNNEDLDVLLGLWAKKGFGAILRGKELNREESLEVTFEFAIECLNEETRKALHVLAWLPAGVASADLDTVLPDGLQTESALYNSGLAFREGSPFRLKMLEPLRNYVVEAHPAGDFEKQDAIEYYLRLTSEMGDRSMPLEGEKLLRLSTEFPNVMEAFKAAVNGGNPLVIDAARGLGRFSVRTGTGLNQCLGALETALKLARRNQDHGSEAGCLWGLGEIACAQSRYEDAEGLYRQTLELCHDAQDRVGEAWCLFGLGDVARMQNRYEDAEGLYGRAGPVFHDAQGRRGEAACLWGLGNIARMQSRYEEAEGLYGRARPLFHDAQSRRSEAACLWGLGEIACIQSRYGDAEGLYRQAQALFHDAHDKGGEAWCLEGLGEIARMQNRNEDAHAFYRQAQSLFHDAQDKGDEARCFERLGDIELNRGQREATSTFWTQARDIFRVANDERLAARVQTKLDAL